MLRYDNESGKGGYKHIGEDEEPYIFTSPEALIDDFWNDVKNGGLDMRTVTLVLSTRQKTNKRLREAFKGKTRGEFITSEL